MSRIYFGIITDLNYVYKKADINGKQEFVRNVFLGGLIKFREGYRTAFIHPMFSDKVENVRHLVVKKEPKVVSIYPSVPFGVDDGT